MTSSHLINYKGGNMYLENFKSLREAKGLSLQNIADQLNLTKQCLHTWEKSRVIPNKYAPEICSILGISLEDQEFYHPNCIVKFRKSLNMSRAAFAALLEVSDSTLSRWERGAMELSQKNTILLHQLYKKLSSDFKSPQE